MLFDDVEEIAIYGTPSQGQTVDCGIYLLYFVHCVINSKKMVQSHPFLKNGRAILRSWIENGIADLDCKF